MDNRPIVDKILHSFTDALSSGDTDAYVFGDFRHGIFSKATIPALTEALRPGPLRVADSQVASRWGNILDFHGFDLITPNEKEARFSLADQDSVVRPLALELFKRAGCKLLILKMGARGIITYRDASAPLLIGLSPQPRVDVGVQWASGVSPGTRTTLEARHGLKAPEAVAAKGWHRYVMSDYSEPNMVALFAERRVVSVDGILGSFRQGYALDEPLDSGARPRIVVAWNSSVSAAQVAEAEHKYRLNRLAERGEALSNPVEYEIDDSSVPNVSALRQDARVRDIAGVHFIRIPVSIRLRKPVTVGPRVYLRWAESVTPAERATLEERFTLRHGSLRDDDLLETPWVYDLEDVSSANVTALATSPKVAKFDRLEPATTPGTFKTDAWTPPRGGEVAVIWGGDVTDAERRLLEQRYHLAPDTGLPETMTHYQLLDASPRAIRALASDPNVAAVGGVDAERGRVRGDSWFTALGRRFAFLRLLPLPRLFLKANAGVWLYYLAYLLPLFVLAFLLIDWWRGRPAGVMPGEAQKMFTVAALMAVANFALLRKMGYFPDHFDAAAIMAAWLLGRALRAKWRRPAGAAVRVIALVMVGVSTVAASAYVDLPSFVDKYGLDRPVSTYPEMIAEKFRSFASSPPIDHYAPKDSIGDRAIVRYLFECTQPEDRIFVTSDIYTVPYYTQRRAVGHVFWANGFMANPDFERRMIDLMERDPVPFLFGVGGERALDNLNSYPQVREYVAKRYTEHHAVLQDNLAGRVFWLLVDSRRTPTSRYEKLGLPCFG